ncbi:MAG TPA: sulfotransferase [Gammaproteobacteria bacterium]
MSQNDLQRPIFVVGTPRSGTTLMAKILNRHSHIFMPGETHFFLDIYAQRGQLGELPDKDAAAKVLSRLATLYRRYNEPADQQRIDQILANPALSERMRAALDGYRNAFSTFMEIQTEVEKKSRWGNNAPKDLFYVDDVLEFYPDAYFIVCIRDPRDFLKSYSGKWKVTAESEADRLKRLYHPVVTSMLWKASMRRVMAIRSKVSRDRLIEIPYEALVSEPEPVLRRICAFLGEVFEPEMLNVTFSNSSDQSAQPGIYAASVASWKAQLSAEEVWIAQKLAGAEMRAFGYEAEPMQVSPLRLMRLLVSTPWALWRALQANRANTGPIIPYLMRRMGGLLGH